MKITNRKTLFATAFALAFGLSATAIADSDTFDVTATVEGVCSLTAGNDLAFGNYNPVTGTAVDGTTTIAVTCSNGMEGTDVGLDFTGSMAIAGEGTATLAYGLFQDVGHATSWGDTAETDRQEVSADGIEQTMTVYGQIEADQNTAEVGSYSETVTATVYW